MLVILFCSIMVCLLVSWYVRFQSQVFELHCIALSKTQSRSDVTCSSKVEIRACLLVCMDIRVGMAYLDETDILALLTETLTADVEAVFADETGSVGADAAVKGEC